jgi:flagellar hook-length control protein FliK
MDNISVPALPDTETAEVATFESLLAQQTQAQSVSQSDELALLLGQQLTAKDPLGKNGAALLPAGEDNSALPEEAPAMFTDLAALFATLVQAAVPMQIAAPMQVAGQAVALAKGVAKPDLLGVDAVRNTPSLVPDDSFPAEADVMSGIYAKPGKEAAEIAATGKDLPVAEAKANVKFNGPDLVKNLTQGDAEVRGMHPATTAEAFSPITGVQGSNAKGIVTVSVEPRVGVPGWDGALGQKVVWLVNQRHQMAEMQLNPPNLGPLEVKITIANDQASALFVSQHVAVRDAIEAALPRLREMLAENGITLGNAQVSAESFPREQTANGDGRSSMGRQPEARDMAMPDTMGERTGVMRMRTPGAVDIFA